MSSFQIRLSGFEGPFDEMVAGVQSGTIPLQELALSQAAGQYLQHLREQDSIHLEETGDVARAMARLAAQKAASLTAQPAESDDSGPPAERVRNRWEEAVGTLRARAGRETFPAGTRDMPRPIQPRKPGVLSDAWHAMAARASSVEARVEVRRFLRLEFALSHVLRWVSDGRTRLSRSLRGAPKDDAVMHFLAVLELVRRGQITAEQDAPFGEIEIAPAGSQVSERSRAG